MRGNNYITRLTTRSTGKKQSEPHSIRTGFHGGKERPKIDDSIFYLANQKENNRFSEKTNLRLKVIANISRDWSGSVADLERFDADPDPTFQADPDLNLFKLWRKQIFSSKSSSFSSP